MRSSYRAVVIGMILVLAIATMAAAPAARKRSAFTGDWQGGDARVKITAFNRVAFTDKSFAACGGGQVSGKGFGTIVDGTLYAGLRMKCKANRVIIDNNYTLTFTKSGAATLVDSNGTVYSLVAKPGCGR